MSKGNHIKQILLKLINELFEKAGGQTYNYKQIANKLNLTDTDSKRNILEILKEETQNGTFIEKEKGKYQLNEVKTFISGKIDMANDG